MITQLNPPLPMETVKGGGWAHFLIDYGPESALLWVVFMDADGACWTIPNSEVRMVFNWTLGRRKADDLTPTLAPADDQAGNGERPPQRFRPTLARQSDG
ncbi:MAG: hypothetical protein WBW74_10230 [Xanthobacteraceae bacterium]